MEVAALRERLRLAPLADLDLDEADARVIGEAIDALRDADAAAVAVATERLLARVGALDVPSDDVFADLPDVHGRPRGILPALALVATAADVVAEHERHGLDHALAASGVADLGQQMRVHASVVGERGLHTQSWLTCAWSGALLRFGALQANVQSHPTEPDAWVWSVHVPDGATLEPAAVDDSLALAAAVLRERFPDRPASYWHCASWLLDPAIGEIVPGSRLDAFRRRWTLTDGGGPGEDDVLFFVFGRWPPWPSLDELPQRTRLERGIVDRLRDGRGWRTAVGLAPVDA